MNRKNKIDFLCITLYQILTLITPFITAPYVSRVLGPDGIGTYSFYSSITSYFIMFILLGLINYGNRSIAAVKDNREILSKTFKSIYTMQFVLGIVISMLYFFICFINQSSLYSYIFGIYVFSAVIDISWFYYGMEKSKLIIIRSAIFKVISIICIFLFVKEKSDLPVYCFLFAISAFLSNLILWISIQSYSTPVHVTKQDVLLHVKPNLLLFIPVIAVSIYKYMDKIMLGTMTGVTQLGLYENAEKWLFIPVALITSLGTVMLPKISNMLAKGESSEKISRIIENSIAFAMSVSIPIAFGIMAISNDLVPWFFGENFLGCAILMQILLPSCIFVAFSNVLRTQYLIPNHKDKIYIQSTILGAIVNLLLNLILIPQYQATGACIGTLCAEAAVCIYQTWHVRKNLRISQYIKNTFPLLLFGIIMYCAVKNFPTYNDVFQTLSLKITFGAVVYSFLVVCYYKVKKLKCKD